MPFVSEEFLLYADEEVRKLLSSRKKHEDFFKGAKALLSPRFEAAMRQAEALKALAEASARWRTSCKRHRRCR